MSTINVFPAGRLCSLRGVLMMWLLPAYVLVGAVSATGAYWSYTHMVGISSWTTRCSCWLIRR